MIHDGDEINSGMGGSDCKNLNKLMTLVFSGIRIHHRSLIILFISALYTTSAFSQTVIKKRDENYFLKFKVLESTADIGKYVEVNADSLEFSEYSPENMPGKFSSQNRMLTLRSSVVIDSNVEKEDWVLVFPPVFYVCNIYLNGKLIGIRGDAKYGYTSRNHTTESFMLSPDLLHRNGKNNEIAIELLPEYGENNSVSGIFVTSRQQGQTYVFWRNFFSIDFTKAMMLSSFMVFLYFFIFSFQRKSESTSYYFPFSMVCLFYPLAYLTNALTFNFADTLLLERITRLGTAFWSYFVLFYMLEFTNITRYKNHIIIVLGVIYIPFIIFGWLPDTVPGVVKFNLKYTSLLNISVTLAAITSCFIFAVRTRTKYAYILALVHLLVIPYLLFDMYYSMVLQNKPYALLLPYMMFLTIVVFFFIVSWQQSDIYKLASKQAVALKNITENLESKVTERTMKLQKSEEQLSLAFQGTSEGLWDWNLKTDETYFSPVWKSMLGYAEDELENNFLTWRRLVHPDDLLHASTYLNEFLDKKHLRYENEYRMLHKNGEHIIVLSRAIKHFDDQTGKVLRLVGTNLNITSIRKAEAQILKLSTALEQSPTTIVITDLKGNIEYANPKFTELTGYTTEESIGQNPSILKSGKTDGKIFTELWQTLNSRKTWQGEFINQKKNGEEFIESAVIAPIFDQKGTIISYVAIKIDITERKIAEAEVQRKNNELQKLIREKDKFFSIIAHDLRGPFNGFLGLTQIMAEESSSLSRKEIQEMAVNMRKSANNLFRLLGNLLHWAGMQQGIISFNKERVILFPLIAESVEMLIESANYKKIDLKTVVPPHLEVFADGNMLQTVIRNLVSNAVKFTPRGGKVSIMAKSTVENYIEISIKDSGIGMNRKMIDNLFRLDIKTNRKGTDGEPSTGLGLLLCKEFVEKHGGRLWVESEEKKGSTFYFTIPAWLKQNGKEVALQNGLAESLGNKIDLSALCLKILIVEDEPMSAMILSKLVEPFCYQLFTAKTGIEAIEVCRNNPDLDLVLMDMHMPEMDGYEATRQIREFRDDLVIIAQTATSLPGEMEQLIMIGCNDSITKPIDNELLSGLIHRYFMSQS